MLVPKMVMLSNWQGISAATLQSNVLGFDAIVRNNIYML